MRELKRELWPFKIKLGKDQSEAEEWLGKTMGIFKGRWNVVYTCSGNYFYFRNERDAVLFSLRWG